MDRLTVDSCQENIIYEGHLNVWEVQKAGNTSNVPVWEPHVVVLNETTHKLSHFRTEKAARDGREKMVVKVSRIGLTKEEFDRLYGYKQVNSSDLLLNSPLASLETVIEKSQTLDSRCSNAESSCAVDKSSSPQEDRRGSTSSLNSQEVTKPSSSSQSKLASFFSKRIKSNLKRTKSATKLDRKKIGNGPNGDAENDNKLPPPFVRSLSLGRISRRWLARPQIGLKGSDSKLREEPSEKIRIQKMGKSHSYESLITSPSSLHCIDLSSEGVEVRPLHCSIFGLDNCFVVSPGGNGGCKYYSCSSAEERNRWIRHLRHVIQPSLEESYRKDNSLEIVISEAKNLPSKKKGFCEICINGTIYARTSSKPIQNSSLFWGEHFQFTCV